MINTKAFKDRDAPTPTSWNDLEDPKFGKHIVIPPITTPTGFTP